MFEKLLQFKINSESIDGSLIIPESANKLVIFSHGSGSSRFSPRNNFVARVLRENGIATFLCDLLTLEEDSTYQNRFDIELLTKRLGYISESLRKIDELKGFKFGYFGASTGAASALNASCIEGNDIFAIVCRGGRPDLAMESLSLVKSPTLLIVGAKDDFVIELNQQAYLKLDCKKQISIVPYASHLFEEPGTLEQVAELSSKWFLDN